MIVFIAITAICAVFMTMVLLSLASEGSDHRRGVKERTAAVEDIEWALWDAERTMQRIEQAARIRL